MWEALLSVISYSVCSSTMLIANKLVMSYIPLPSLVSSIQLVVCGFSILVCQSFGLLQLEFVDRKELTWLFTYSGIFFYVICCFSNWWNSSALFVSGIYFNLVALEHSNVETIIVARSCLPLVTSILDFFFLGRQVRFCVSFLTDIDCVSSFWWQLFCSCRPHALQFLL